jgi:hypothetical protein
MRTTWPDHDIRLDLLTLTASEKHQSHAKLKPKITLNVDIAFSKIKRIQSLVYKTMKMDVYLCVCKNMTEQILKLDCIVLAVSSKE